VSISVVKCSLVNCSECCSVIIRRHIDNRKLLLICILLLSHSLVFFRFLFYKYMAVIYVFLLEKSMYSYC